MSRAAFRLAALLALAVLPAACHDATPTAAPLPDDTRVALDCVADVSAGTLACAAPAPTGGASPTLIVGAQNYFVRLSSTNVAYDSATDIFRADVVVRNLLAQTMGSRDGVTLDSAGIKVFFHTGPTVTGGSGSVTVANEDGTGTFTGAGQPFFRYDEVLQPYESTAPHTWQWNVPGTVTSFAFTAYVAAEVTPELVINEVMGDPAAVADSAGEWIELHNPGAEDITLTGWTLASGGDAGFTLPAVVVPKWGYVVLARNGDGAQNGGVAEGGVYTGIVLTESGDWLRLRNPAGATVDSVAWSTALPSGASAALRGFMLQHAQIGGAGSAWSPSTATFGDGDRGTPGASNSDVIVNQAQIVQAITPDDFIGKAMYPLADSQVVRVVNATGVGVGGVTVQWAVHGSGSVSPATRVTNSQGFAKTRWTLGGVIGTQTLTAAVVGVDTATFTAHVPPLVDVQLPLAGANYGDSLFVKALVRLPGAVASVVADVSGHTASLSYNAGTGFWTGAVNLAGLTPGVKTLQVTATDAAAYDTTATVQIVYDSEPDLTVTLPFVGQVGRPDLRVTASCTDEGPGGCVSLRVLQVEDPTTHPNYGTVLATGSSSVDQIVSLAAYDGTRILLRFEATDGAGKVTKVHREIFVESSSRLVPVDSAGVAMIDADASTILYHDTVGSVRVLRMRPLGGGAVSTLLNDAALRPMEGWLMPGGALYRRGTVGQSCQEHLMEWYAGTTSDLADLGCSRVAVDSTWAAWSVGSIFRRDLAARTTAVVSGTPNGSFDVAPNGVVVYTGAASQLFRYDGATTQITTSSGSHLEPRTDGTNTIYTRVVTGADSVKLIRPGGEDLLAVVAGSGPTDRQYQARNGWAAYLKLIPGDNDAQVWVRSPGAVHTEVTGIGATTMVVALAPNGDVVYQISGINEVWLARAPFTSPPVRIAKSGQYMGIRTPDRRVIWRDGYFYLFLGRTLFRVVP